MSNYEVFSIYDGVAHVYGEPFLSASSAIAIRRFNYVMKNAPMVSADCSLYRLGSFDTEMGAFIVSDKPEFLCRYEEEPIK